MLTVSCAYLPCCPFRPQELIKVQRRKNCKGIMDELKNLSNMTKDAVKIAQSVSSKKRSQVDFVTLIQSIDDWLRDTWVPPAVDARCRELCALSATKFSGFDTAASMFKVLGETLPKDRAVQLVERCLERVAPHMGRCARPPAEARIELHRFVEKVVPVCGFLDSEDLTDLENLRLALSPLGSDMAEEDVSRKEQALDSMKKLREQSLLVPVCRVPAVQTSLTTARKELSGAARKLTGKATVPQLGSIVSQLNDLSEDKTVAAMNQLPSAMARAAKYLKSTGKDSDSEAAAAKHMQHASSPL